jgi:hypothetical protein
MMGILFILDSKKVYGNLLLQLHQQVQQVNHEHRLLNMYVTINLTVASNIKNCEA